MDRLDAMTLFLTAVDEGSLAAAARRHARSPAAVTRAVALLEQQAGETLLLRSTRRLSLTAAGQRHVEVWRDVLGRLHEIAPGVSPGPLRGSLVLTAPELFGRATVMPIVTSFLRDHPLVSVRFLLANRVVDLVGEGVDLAIRLMALPDSALSATRLGELRALIVATPAYLAQAGIPERPQDLVRYECIGLNAESDGEPWSFKVSDHPGSGVRTVRVSTRLSLNSAAAALEAALQGHGLVRVRSYQVIEHLRTGRLVSVLDSFEPPPDPVHLILPASQRRREVIRAFVDHAVPLMKAALAEAASTLPTHMQITG